MEEEFDFIIVGAGPAGCVLAHRLSHAHSAPRILLLEAGSDPTTNNNDSSSIHSVTNRYLNVQLPHLDWGYTSTPQSQLHNRTIPCGRGRVLGGSTTTNFGVWTVGHAEDFNEWARRVGGDEAWMWEGEQGVRERFRRMVNLHVGDGEEEESWRGVLDREALRRRHANADGTGMVDLMYNQVCDEFESFCLDAFREFGVEFSGDLNDGDPSGVSIPPVTFYNGSRVTAASAYLASRPKNLTIRTEIPIASVMFDEHKRGIGVKTLTGEIIRASKEVILSSGTFNSPKILLLSGVGPADDLKKLSIPVIADLPVGKNLKDHCCVTSTLLLKPDVPGAAISERVRKLRSTIRDPLLWVNVQNPLAWLSSPTVRRSPEFAALDPETRSVLQKVPSFELMMNNSRVGLDVTPPPPGSKTLMLMGAVMNPQSCGSVTLASADPSAAPLIDLNYLSHPYDRRVAIEILRKNIAFSETPAIKEVTEKRIEGPSIDADDETLFAHCKRSVMPVWHFASTCKMGRDDDSTAVVDKNFRVRGVHSLRVVDLSVAPVLPNNHTQSTAYLVGETAAEKIIAEYAL